MCVVTKVSLTKGVARLFGFVSTLKSNRHSFVWGLGWVGMRLQLECGEKYTHLLFVDWGREPSSGAWHSAASSSLAAGLS